MVERVKIEGFYKNATRPNELPAQQSGTCRLAAQAAYQVCWAFMTASSSSRTAPRPPGSRAT